MADIPGQAILYAPDGSKIVKDLPARLFTPNEARTLRDMKKLLMKYRWQVMYRCRICMDNGEANHLVDAYVYDDRIGFLCAHQQVVFQGSTV